MSKANGAIENKDTYLQHVSLKNYKSIKDAEIDFKPGLNIIIGKNASGKTNFVNGLDNILNFNYDELLDIEFIIKARFHKYIVEIQALNKNQNAEDILKNDYHHFSVNHDMLFKINGEQIEINYYEELFSALIKRDLFFIKVLIKYGVFYNETAQFINLPFSFILINNRRISSELLRVFSKNGGTRFIQGFFQQLYLYISKSFHFDDMIDNMDLKNKIISFSEQHFQNLNDLISKFIPIQAIRLNPDFNIIKEEESQKQTVTNFYLEFLIDQNWLPFHLLSDGTQRLFYVISEMLATYDNPIDNNELPIILLEEPELGIHPHQLHQLMQFIKEQSREKQIILTTHSPQVLDVLEPDELDRVIICHYDSKKGTQLRHLTEKEINKAKKYMKDDFLSDYWRFSNLEPA